MAVRKRAGRLRHRISILSPTTARDSDYGEPTASSTGWTTDASNIAAAIEPLRGDERFGAEQDIGSVTHRILMYHSTTFTVTSAKRIQFGSRLFDIEVPMNLEERGILWEILARERV